jgi:hypothetical protein
VPHETLASATALSRLKEIARRRGGQCLADRYDRQAVFGIDIWYSDRRETLSRSRRSKPCPA